MYTSWSNIKNYHLIHTHTRRFEIYRKKENSPEIITTRKLQIKLPQKLLHTEILKHFRDIRDMIYEYKKQTKSQKFRIFNI